MRCPKCGAEISKEWRFCPRCGARARRNFFEEIFGRFRREMGAFDRMFERSFEAFDISPFFKAPPKGKGFTIRIVRKTGQPPKVSVKTFGPVNRERIEKEVKAQLGVPAKVPPVREVKEVKPAVVKPAKLLPAPKVTEEPKTEVRRIDSKVIVDMEIPGVREEKDIEIRELEQSVEVKAIADAKAYFKILTKPAQFRLAARRFEPGKLHLEFA